ncbi:MAG: hypothetical protein KJP08_05775 [Gammaproteobacteria bacterium]|nr:hypothetical protein [Gammaproteobacteria bacterium]NNF48351.1 hypothetical protein [Woeseiaceae bacterium]MBT8094301.1 hypothetical protein [Gammaproteobacteria bacterium]MBT8105994.1 hypothetical protein [Gammaproteobacteria bacterium]NNK26008.1 hypothetical protein [Woeseiaceae bacterium]
MKNLLLLLILANVLYFMWGRYATQDPQPGVAVVSERDLGPPLEFLAAGDNEATTSVGAVLGSGDPSDLAAVVGRACVTIGPFSVRSDADTAVLEYAAAGMQTAVRSMRTEVFIGQSVQVTDVASRAAGREMVRVLERRGLDGPFVVGNDEIGYSIALGIFSDAANAERVELQARSAGFVVETTPMTRNQDVFFVDVGLPPGRGAGAIVERYGEDRVALRDAATCPR